MLNQSQISAYYDTFLPLYQIYQMGSFGLHFGYFNSGKETHKESVLNVNRFMAEKVQIKSSDIILDAGCGIGGSAFWLAKNFGAQITGITISKNQLGTAKKLSQSLKLTSQVNFHLMDFCHTDFADETFTVVWAIESVCHANNKAEFLKEVYRLLKPNGRLIIADGFLNREPITQTEKKTMQDFYQGFYLDNIATLKTFKSGLQTASFKRIKYWDKKKEIMRSASRANRISQILHPISHYIRNFSTLFKIFDDTMVTFNAFQKGLQADLITHGVFYAQK